MTTVKQLTLSDVAIRSALQRNPQGDLAEQSSEAFCTKWGARLPNFYEYATMSPYLFPDTSVERLTAISNLNNILFYIDDTFDVGRIQSHGAHTASYIKEMLIECAEAFLLGRLPKNPLALHYAFAEMHQQFSTLTSAAWLRRFVYGLTNHLSEIDPDLETTREDGHISIERYIYLRTINSGMYPTVDLIEFAKDIFLPDAILRHPNIERMRLVVIRLASLLNDMFSYHKEVIVSGSRFNFLAVLMDTTPCGFDEAVDRAVRLLNHYLADFEEDAMSLPVWENAADNVMQAKYVQGLRDQLSASWHWQLSTNRYRASESPFVELRQFLPNDHMPESMR